MVNFENVVASTKNLKESRNILLLIFISNIKLGLSNTNRNEIETVKFTVKHLLPSIFQSLLILRFKLNSISATLLEDVLQDEFNFQNNARSSESSLFQATIIREPARRENRWLVQSRASRQKEREGERQRVQTFIPRGVVRERVTLRTDAPSNVMSFDTRPPPS